jgi:hypothetical protein
MEITEANQVLIKETEGYLRRIPTLPATETFTPVGHGLFIDVLHEEVDKAGLTIVGKDYYSHQDGKIAVGKYDLIGADISDKDMGLALLWHNSVNKKTTGKIAAGANVGCCDNGLVWGDHTIRRKHTGSIEQDIREFAARAIGKLEENFEQLKRDKEHMKDIIITEDDAAKFLGRAFLYEGLLTGEQLNIVKKEMKSSENFPMFQNWLIPDRDNVWNMYNNITESLKESHSSQWINKHVQLHDLVKNEWGF